MKVTFIFLLTFLFYSCSQQTEVIISPSKQYSIQVEVNESREDSKKYGCIILSLLDANGKELSKTFTSVSSFAKWAVTWHPTKDTILIKSQDLGDIAWQITGDNLLSPVVITSDLQAYGVKAFEKKYSP